MMQTGLYDWQTRFEQLDNGGDPLVKLNEVVKWELFCDDLQHVRDKNRKSDAGRKPFDVVLMFKILILQSLYNLSDDQVEFQVRDRLSFMRFLGLSLGDTVPDAKTVWLFREQLAQAGRIKSLFERFDSFLPAEAKRIADKLEIHYTPKHGSWLDMAEIELGILARQCLSRRINNTEQLKDEVDAWQAIRNTAKAKVNWRFTTDDARIKLKKLYPSIEV